MENNIHPTFGHGKICYIEIPSIDIDRSVAFYNKVFKWQIRKHDDGSMAFDDGVGEVSGTWVTGKEPSTETGMLIHIMVFDMTRTLELIIDNGGKITRPAGFQAPEVTAHFSDPAGNIFGLYQHHLKEEASTINSIFIKASPEIVYQAFTDPEAIAVWLAPGEMTGKIYSYDLKVGGGYQMSLFYPQSENESSGKTAEREDRFTARFVELMPPHKIVQAINFESDNAAYVGEMTMEVTFEREDSGTRVVIVFKNIPSGIRPEDNEAGTQMSLEKLKHYTEGD